MGVQSAGVRAMVFNPDGRTILTAMQDSLKVIFMHMYISMKRYLILDLRL